MGGQILARPGPASACFNVEILNLIFIFDIHYHDIELSSVGGQKLARPA